MRFLLIMLCGLVVLFAGGHALLAVGFFAVGIPGGPFAFVPGGIAALNLLVILAAWGQRKPDVLAFAALAILDLLIGVPLMLIAVPDFVVVRRPPVRLHDPARFFIGILSIGLVVKGVLTLLVGWRLVRRGSENNDQPESPS